MSAQNSLFVDSRDGKTYPIVEVGELLWFGTNLSYESVTSWCAEDVKEKHCTDGNYYYNTGLDSLCPKGWRVATWTDWENSIKRIVQQNGMNPDSITYDTTDWTTWSSVLFLGFNLMDDTLSLNVKINGWVEGKKGKKGKAKRSMKYTVASYWVIDEETNDPRMHMHMDNTGLNKHNHSTRRRFGVRCVSDKK